MRIPNLPTRPLIAAADKAAELVLTTGTGRTHASEPANRQDTKNIDGSTAVRFKLSGPSSPSLATNARQRQANQDHGLRQRGEQEVVMG